MICGTLFTQDEVKNWTLRLAGTFFIYYHISGVSVIISYYLGDRFVAVLKEGREPEFLTFWQRLKVKRFFRPICARSRRVQLPETDYPKFKKELDFIATRPVFIDPF